MLHERTVEDIWKIIEERFCSNNHILIQKLKNYYQYILYYNSKVNLVSRKNTEYNLVLHIFYSLTFLLFKKFNYQDKILDLGTGGGLPGIPLSILFPNTQFVLVDSMQKKTHVIEKIIHKLQLKNVTIINQRVENLKINNLTYILAKTVADTSKIYSWTFRLRKINVTCLQSYFLWKGGDDVENEMQNAKLLAQIHKLPKEGIFELLENKCIVEIKLRKKNNA